MLTSKKKASSIVPNDKVVMVSDVGAPPFSRVVSSNSNEFGVPVIRFHGSTSVLRCHPDRLIVVEINSQ